METDHEPRLYRRPIPIPVAGRDCPRCHAFNSMSALECRSCGVVFERYKPVADGSIVNEMEVAGRSDLIFLWNDLVEDYVDLNKHDSFLMACLEAQNLPYAARKYSEILAVAPQEETALKMRRQIIGFAGVHLEGASPVLSFSTWKMPLPSFNNFILLLGTIALVVGLWLPHMRDVAKLGSAMIALAIGLAYFMRSPA